MDDCRINIKDADGVDLGYKLVRKKGLADEISKNSDNLLRGGNLWVWGCNPNGILGINNNSCWVSSPVQTVAGGSNWKHVQASYYSNVVSLKTDGTLWTWGQGCRGVLGDNSTVSKSSPVQTSTGGTNWKQASAVGGAVAAIKNDGSLWLWGCSPSSLGLRSQPVQPASNNTQWRKVSLAGGRFLGNCVRGAGIKEDGTLWVFRNSADICAPRFENFSSESYKFCDVKTNKVITAIHENGSMWICGDRNLSTLGVSTGDCFKQSYDKGCDWKKIQDVTTYNSSVALKKDNTIWAWGYVWRTFRSLEYSTNPNFYYAADIYGAAASFSVGKNSWSCLITLESSQNAAGIKTDGTLWTWGCSPFFVQDGKNSYDANINIVNKSVSLTQVGFESGWKSLTGTRNSGFAIKE
jgi:alpha-tubulin suppressor-like RCC1 family protein